MAQFKFWQMVTVAGYLQFFRLSLLTVFVLLWECQQWWVSAAALYDSLLL